MPRCKSCRGCLEGSGKNADAQITQLKNDMAGAQKDAQGAILQRNDEIKKMEQVVVRLQGDIAQEKKLRDEAMKGKSELENALQKKIEELSMEKNVLVANATKVAQEKNQQVQQMNAQIEKSKVEAGRKQRRIDSCSRNSSALRRR